MADINQEQDTESLDPKILGVLQQLFRPSLSMAPTPIQQMPQQGPPPQGLLSKYIADAEAYSKRDMLDPNTPLGRAYSSTIGKLMKYPLWLGAAAQGAVREGPVAAALAAKKGISDWYNWVKTGEESGGNLQFQPSGQPIKSDRGALQVPTTPEEVPRKASIPIQPTGETTGKAMWGKGAGEESTTPSIAAAPPTPGSPPQTGDTEDEMKKKLAEGIDVKPWKPKTDLEKELMNIFESTIPKWEDLPKTYEMDTSTPLGAATQVARDAALKVLGKDPIGMREEELQAKRNYMVQRASQLANIKLSGLNYRMQQEEASRDRHLSYLNQLWNWSGGQVGASKAYRDAVAADYGVDPKEVDSIFKSFTDKDGKLNLAITPQEVQMNNIKMQSKLQADMYREAGVPEDQIKYAVATGSLDPQQFYTTRISKAIQDGDIEKAKMYRDKLTKLGEFANIERNQAAATLADMAKNPGKYSQYFSDKSSFETIKKYLMAQSMGLKGIKFPTDKAGGAIHLKEEFVRETLEVTKSKDPKLIAEYQARTGMNPYMVLHAYFGVKEDGASNPNTPEPYATMFQMFNAAAKSSTAAQAFMNGTDPFSKGALKAVHDKLRVDFLKPISEINKHLPKNKPITDDELDDLINAQKWGGDDGWVAKLQEIMQSRK